MNRALLARRVLVTLVLLAGAPAAAPQTTSRARFRLPDLAIPIPGGSGSIATIGDLDADGDLEIVAASSRIHAWHHDGTPLAGFPLAGGAGFPVLADLDGDPLGDLEVLFCTWSQPAAYVYAYHHVDLDGIGRADPVAGWPAVLTAPLPIFASSFPSVEDLDGDGSAEVVVSLELHDFPGQNAAVHVLGAQGSPAAGAWPRLVEDHSFRYSAAAIGDLDGNGLRDVVMKAVAAPLANQDYVHAWDPAGLALAGFPALHTSGPGPESASSAVLGDLAGDGGLDVVTCLKREVVAVDSQGVELFRHDVESGRPLTPALADLDDDGDLELVIGVEQGQRAFVVVLDHQGQRLARSPTLGGRAHPSLSALVGDLDGDGRQELLLPVRGAEPGGPSRIHVFDGDGSWRPDLSMLVPADPYVSQCARLGDLDGDGDVELVTAGQDHVYVWNFRGSPADCDWPMFQHDAHLSGRFE